MTEDRQRQAMAEICGYEQRPDGYWRRVGMVGSCGIPDYLNSLDAMHEAEKVLDEEKKGQTLDYLCEIVRRDHNPDLGPMTAIITACFANASQRREAFLKTHNRWEEGV